MADSANTFSSLKPMLKETYSEVPKSAKKAERKYKKEMKPLLAASNFALLKKKLAENKK